MRQQARLVVIIVGDGAVLTHLVEETRDTLFDMRLGDVRRALAIAVVLLRRLLALLAIIRLAVLRMLGLQLHLTLLQTLHASCLLHSGMLGLRRVHARPQTADIARQLFLAADAVRVDEVVGLGVVVGCREEHGRHRGLRVVEVHVHVGIHVDARRPATETRLEPHVANTGAVSIVHRRHIGRAANRQTDLLLVLVIIMAGPTEALTLLLLIEGRDGAPVLACRLRRSFGLR